MLPSGDLVWVHTETPGTGGNGRDGDRPQDVGFRDNTETILDGLQVPGFTEAVRGVVASVRHALDEHRPDSAEVEFGIEISARTGKRPTSPRRH
jgi:hypothetical protein